MNTSDQKAQELFAQPLEVGEQKNRSLPPPLLELPPEPMVPTRAAARGSWVCSVVLTRLRNL
jgi:hypothetical protein